MSESGILIGRPESKCVRTVSIYQPCTPTQLNVPASPSDTEKSEKICCSVESYWNHSAGTDVLFSFICAVAAFSPKSVHFRSSRCN